MTVPIVRRLTPIFILLAFGLMAVIMIKTSEKQEQKITEPSITLVKVKAAKQKTVSLNLPSYGVVNPKYKTQLVAEVQGRLLEITPDFVVGSTVKKGTILAYIEPFDYEADLIQAKAALAQSLAALDEEIAKGKVAEMEFKDFNQGLPPELGLRVPQLKKEQANVKYAQAVVDRAKRNLERTVIRAPFSGIVRSRSVELGQYVNKGHNLGELYGTQIAEIRLPIANTDLAYLESVDNPNTNVTLTTSLAGKEISWNGNIVRSEGVIDPQNRMIYLVAEIPDPYNKINGDKNKPSLKFGTFVNATIKGRTVEGIVKLPRYLVRNNKIAIVTKDNTIEIRTVNVIRTDLENVYIKDSLKNNELVSLTSVNNLSAGQTVKIFNDRQTSPSSQSQESRLVAVGEQ